MRFVDFLIDFLQEKKEIYTVRRLYYGKAPEVVYVEGVGGCKRVLVKEVRKEEELEPYVALSGFDSLDSWVRKIKEFNPSPGNLYLYHLEVI